MPSKIRILSDQTIDQIAAGEVIEGPASVVKELVENAIDAEATQVHIEILGGGHYKICVKDNGTGIARDDVCLAFERHATSKIKQVSDLERLTSMGFRGEALASIASCSKVELISCERGADIGAKFTIYGGKQIKLEAAARMPGTTVDVSSLFYNLPARKAFQKSKSQSTSEIVKMVTKLALAHPHVAFELISHEQVLLTTSGEKEKVVHHLLGDLFKEEVRNLAYAENGCQIEGVISTPLNTRKNRTGQYLFINGRPIYSPFISKAVQEAYGTRISSSEYPLFVLWIAIPPHLIDVNVHPQKSQVRFQSEEMVEQLIAKAFAKVFGQVTSIPQLPKTALAPSSKEFFVDQTVFSQRFREEAAVYDTSPKVAVETQPRISLLASFGHFAFVRIEKDHPLFEGLGPEEKIVFVDLLSAEKRLCFDALIATWKEQKECPKQQLLFTETLEFPLAEALEVKEKLSLLQKMGIGIRPFGERAFIVDSLAEFLSLDNLKEIISKSSPKLTEEELAKTIAAAYRRGKNYSQTETLALVQALFKSSDPGYTPTGKRILRSFNVEQFGEWIARSN